MALQKSSIFESAFDGKEFREYLAGVVAGRGAHITFAQAVAGFPEGKIGNRVPHSEKHSITRQAITAADHNSFHIGQLVDLRMLLEERVKDW